MPITSGIALEPRTDNPEMQDATQARVHDPLWFLARQWQFGELQGQNTGSPTQVEFEAEFAPLSRYRPGGDPNGAAQIYAPDALPLETLVEREALPMGTARDQGLLAEAGLHFLRLLDAHGAGAYRTAYCGAYPFPAPTAQQRQTWDPANLRRLDLFAGRLPDAGRLFHDLGLALGPDGGGPGPLPEHPAIAPDDRPKVQAAARDWLRWFATQGYSPATASAWLPERMEYTFAVAAHPQAAEVTLSAPEYHGGRLDWDTFVLEPAVSLAAPAASRIVSGQVMPTPVTYRGMPSARLWAFEDGRVNLGAIQDGQGDAGRWALAEFAMVYGNDWLLIPLEMAVGSLCRLRSLAVRDSFGEITPIPHYRAVDGPETDWRFWALSSAGVPAGEDLFYLPPVLGPLLESPPLEDVLLLRDEMANMAWAVERVVSGPAGLRLDRFEAFQSSRPPDTEAPDRAGQGLAPNAYRLGVPVPDHWIPLLPVQTTTDQGLGLRFQRAAMPRFGADGAGVGIPPLGTLLQPGRELSLFGEEIPREGAQVSRNAHFARWGDGSSHLWIGAGKRPGRGEGSSGLRFDLIEPGAAPRSPYPATPYVGGLAQTAESESTDLAAENFKYGLDLI